MTENINETVDESVEVAAEVEAESFDLTATLTADLQRLQAEYSNYRKRVERDRAVASEIAIASVLSELLSTLDDIDRAAQHGELTGGFKSVADQLINTTTKLGLEKYGQDGDEFDPQIHEALMHDTSADVKVATASKILQPGYKFKERVLRPARVSVTDPE
ncbi:MAG: nucleotide exchange factor GrpE [Candidatus Nanopelagicaceae bacterium]|jgi:molecular chaperone GrpE|nr:nucleotide exchange factor GrpE [Candidatus Nanopelagicaceae bacterium]